MGWEFETLGNASVLVFDAGRPRLITDPWLEGTAYFGSWSLEQPLDERQLADAAACPYVWISHGHPDHLHPPSLARLDRRCEVLVPDHYSPELQRCVSAAGLRTRVLPHKRWMTLEPGLRVLCVANENMDAVLAIDAGGALILDMNDAPLCGEEPFFRQLARSFNHAYLLALCATDADMLNLHDSGMTFIAGDPRARKPGTIWAVGRNCDALGIGNFCCSSSQHVYSRPDSAWANSYRITLADMQKYWCARARLIEPFVRVNLDTGEVFASSRGDSPCPIQPADDWDETLAQGEWDEVEAFVRRFELLARHHDFVGFRVGGETRHWELRPDGRRVEQGRQRGVVFHVPRTPLLEAVRRGYFDDLLIGNFMKTQLFNMTSLYPNFTPIIAKLGGAGVVTRAQLRRFRWHFFTLSPAAYVRYRWQRFAIYHGLPLLRRWTRAVGLFGIAKKIRAWLFGAPRAI